LREALYDARRSSGPALVIIDGLELFLTSAETSPSLPAFYALLTPPPQQSPPLAVLASWTPPDHSLSPLVTSVLRRFHMVMNEGLSPLTSLEEIEKVVGARLPEVGGQPGELKRVIEKELRLWPPPKVNTTGGIGVSLSEIHRSVDLYCIMRRSSTSPVLSQP